MLSYDKAPPSHYGSVRSSSLSAPSMSQRGVRAMQYSHSRHIFVVYGPAGCGKTTVASSLAGRFQFAYIEGDEFHPAANVEKMAAGMPLEDQDRWDWLMALREEALTQLEGGAQGVMLTCSALKHKYRDVIRLAALVHGIQVHFLYLHAAEEVLLQRVKTRQGHFMKESMVRSQLADLEEPTRREDDVLPVNVSGSIKDVERLSVEAVWSVLTQDSTELQR